MQMQADGVSRRDLLSGVAGAAIVAAPALANAETEYPNVPYLGGSDQVLLVTPYAQTCLSNVEKTRQGATASRAALENHAADLADVHV